MKPASNWQAVAERLTEFGWSWKLSSLPIREKAPLHVAQAWNDDGEAHAVVAETIEPAFAALEHSINSVGHAE